MEDNMRHYDWSKKIVKMTRYQPEQENLQLLEPFRKTYGP